MEGLLAGQQDEDEGDLDMGATLLRRTGGEAREFSPSRWPSRVMWLWNALAERRTTSDSRPSEKRTITVVIILATSKM